MTTIVNLISFITWVGIAFLSTLALYLVSYHAYWWCRLNIYWRFKFWRMDVQWQKMKRSGAVDFVNKQLRGELPREMTFEEYKKTL
jgi:hypothetical protein